jgi:hypothetical protein
MTLFLLALGAYASGAVLTAAHLSAVRRRRSRALLRRIRWYLAPLR